VKVLWLANVASISSRLSEGLRFFAVAVIVSAGLRVLS
jgi:hypothetical protein